MKTIKCKYCHGTHRVVKNYYCCPKVWGGVVKMGKPALPKVKYVRKCLCKRITNRWEWEAALWYGETILAECMVKSAPSYGFDTEDEAVSNMNKVLSRFGVTKRTKAA